MFVIHAEKRLQCGTNYSKRLRRVKNRIPIIVYGFKKSHICLSLDHDTIFNIYKKPKFHSNTITLVVSNEKYLVFLKSIQMHSFKLKILHIDFLYKP
ncbi:50S ribosomal protein L25 [Buchnera aphidicola]|uniref:50S ribosomal protein L25 n=1 Tax=Buchnera aphidicola TaxID=9 RepID=UPI003464BDAF